MQNRLRTHEAVTLISFFPWWLVMWTGGGGTLPCPHPIMLNISGLSKVQIHRSQLTEIRDLVAKYRPDHTSGKQKKAGTD